MRKMIVRCDRCGADQTAFVTVEEVVTAIRSADGRVIASTKDADLCDGCVEDLASCVNTFMAGRTEPR